MAWDAFQHEVLAALGHTVFAPVSGSGDAAAPVPNDALTLALLRAAARTPDAPDAATLCRSWPPASRLRDVASKRALWPRLRALRAQA